MRLTSLELNFTGQWDDQDDLEPLVRFVKSFEGLEDLYIEARDINRVFVALV
jgi:hypothetical protein